MSAPPRHRGAIVRAAATLFRRNGFAATGINEIAEVSGAPKGSLYHYFPDGKDQIAEAAMRFAGAGLVATLEKLEQEHDIAASMIRAYCRLLAGWMAKSGFRDGCPISTTLAGVGAAIRCAHGRRPRSVCRLVRRDRARAGSRRFWQGRGEAACDARGVGDRRCADPRAGRRQRGADRRCRKIARASCKSDAHAQTR